MREPVQTWSDSVIGGYRLDSVIGRGGMGAVYRAEHTRLRRTAAVKVLDPNLANDEEYVSRFFQEARIVNEIGHPNIIDIVDFVDESEPRCVAYIMELLEGPPLSEVLRNQVLSVRQTANVLLQLANALEAVHRIDVVHRDLKPDNLLIVAPLDSDLSDVPSVKVLDFGIAKVQDQSAQHRTATGMLLGTPAYMAPEQIASQPVSPATDIYAIGELWFEMLTGRRAFPGESASILRQKVRGNIPDLSVLPGAAFRHHIEVTIGQCLTLRPEERPTIATLQAELRAILRNEPGRDDSEANTLAPKRPRTHDTLFAGGAIDAPDGSTIVDPTVPEEVLRAREEAKARAASQAQDVTIAPRVRSVPSTAPVPTRAVTAKEEALSLRTLGVGLLSLAALLATAMMLSHPGAKVEIEPLEPERPAANTLPLGDTQVAVETRPAGAQVLDAETRKTLGTAPLKIDLPAGVERRAIEVRQPGHLPSVVWVDRHRREMMVILAPAEEGQLMTPATPRVPRSTVAPKKGAGPAPKGPIRRFDLPEW